MPTGIPGHHLTETLGDGHRAVSRVRSRVACRGCNHRKVRCDVTRTGIPCSNCQHEDSACEVLPRKKHRPRRPKSDLGPALSEQVAVPDTSTPARAKLTGRERYIEKLAGRSTHVNNIAHDDFHPEQLSVSQSSHFVGDDKSTPGSVAERPITSLDADDILPDDSSLSYIGDKRGARRFVYDLCHPGAPQDAKPFFLPEIRSVPWKPHEVEYLNHQEVFKVLPNDVCDDLIRCYFHHVHFFLPILDVPNFLNEYVKNGCQNLSLLLLWSMFLAAANFVESDTLRKAGFASRKAMKTAMYERAKALYDLDHGTDRLILIQSVILMGFWYSDPQDHTGAWYWIGIAIGLCQNLGLHRAQSSSSRSQRFSESRQSLTRRIWWTCLVRDRWVSLAKGRPMRIHHEDCDAQTPLAEDVLHDFESIASDIRARFIPDDCELLSRMWVGLVKVSSALGNILRVHYSARGATSGTEELHINAEELRQCAPQIVLPENAGRILLLHAYQLDLFYEATAVVLYRPYVLNGFPAVARDGEDNSQKFALDQARVAASNTNTVLEKIIDLDVVHFLKPMIITAFIPAMQIHLLDCKSNIPLRRGLGSNKLNLCMLVLAQLKDTYWSASVIYRLFERAQSMLRKPRAGNSNPLDTQCTSPRRTAFEADIQDDSGNQYVHRQYHSQDTRENQRIRQHREEQDSADYMLTTVEANNPVNNPGIPIWLDDSPSFSTVDQLLSPGFSISENGFQPFFTDFDGTGAMSVYDPMLPLSVSGQMSYQGSI